MDHAKFIEVVKQFPQVWNRNCPTFKEQELKNEAWQRIGETMGCPAAAAKALAKDTFKSLREKYVREREKHAMYGDKYVPWLHLESLSFLDPHIILRKQAQGCDAEPPKRLERCKLSPSDESLFAHVTENYNQFDKALIALVRKARPIWDRKSNGYSSKDVKFQLWGGIADATNKDANVCMMRWKGLREKYIRQKNKYLEGGEKWDLLDDMAFLDSVIQYKRKSCDLDASYAPQPEQGVHFLSGSKKELYDESSVHSLSSNDFNVSVKSENVAVDEVRESSYDSGTVCSRKKRSGCDSNGDNSSEKKERGDDVTEKSPEAMFGELVAAMLAKKTEREKNVAMIEVMKILAK